MSEQLAGVAVAAVMPAASEAQLHCSAVSQLQDDARLEESDHVDQVLAQWAAVRPDLDTAPVGIIARLGRATAYIDTGINVRLGEFGLTREAWDVLASLRRSGPPYRLSPTELYVALMRSSGAMTHRLAGLERAGLVKRVADPNDGRSVLVELTRKGLALVDRVTPEHLANERALLAGLSEPEQRMLAELLRKLLRRYETEQHAPRPSSDSRRRFSRRVTRRAR